MSISEGRQLGRVQIFGDGFLFIQAYAACIGAYEAFVEDTAGQQIEAFVLQACKALELTLVEAATSCSVMLCASRAWRRFVPNNATSLALAR